MWSGILDNVASSAQVNANAQLILNFRHPLIQKLSTVENRALVAQILEVLYLQSLLLGHYPLANGERKILANGLLGLLDQFLGEKQ